MRSRSQPPQQQYRVWIARTEEWDPQHWSEVPRSAMALHPADEQCMSAAEAASFLSGFNGEILDHPRAIWAVAIPVGLRYEGDLRPGQRITAGAAARLPREE